MGIATLRRYHPAQPVAMKPVEPSAQLSVVEPEPLEPVAPKPKTKRGK